MSMSRYYGKKARRLSVDGETFMWRVRHRHTVSTDQYRGCIEILELRRFRAPGVLPSPSPLVPAGTLAAIRARPG